MFTICSLDSYVQIMRLSFSRDISNTLIVTKYTRGPFLKSIREVFPLCKFILFYAILIQISHYHWKCNIILLLSLLISIYFRLYICIHSCTLKFLNAYKSAIYLSPARIYIPSISTFQSPTYITITNMIKQILILQKLVRNAE